MFGEGKLSGVTMPVVLVRGVINPYMPRNLIVVKDL